MLNDYKNSKLKRPPGVKSLTNEITSLKNNLKDEKFLRIINLDLPITLAMDGWKNSRGNKVFNLILLDGYDATYLTSIEHNLLECAKHDSEFLSNKVAPFLRQVIAQGIFIIGITADNEPLNKATVNLLRSEFPYLIYCPCFNHTLNLCVKRLLTFSEFERI